MTKARLLILCCMLGLVSCTKAVRTSNDASPSEVRFLKLPKNATDIRFWDDGNNRAAVFSISESAFLEMFPETVFEEIAEPMIYYDGGFGDASMAPWKGSSHATAKSGKFFEKIDTNGGGVTLIFDRDHQIGYVNTAGW